MKAIIHLCSAHLLHGVGFYLYIKYEFKKDMIKLFLHPIGFMVRITDFALINIDCLAKSIGTLLNNWHK